MIEIKCAAAETAAMLCAAEGVSANKVLEMTERNERLGWCAAVTDGEEATVLCLRAPDTALTDALLRALLNALRADGVKTAHIAEEALGLFMQRRDYFSDSAERGIKIADFFAKSTCKV